MPQSQLKVMISSTARDLPEHRKEAMDACLRQGMFPTMMEHLPSLDAAAISASLRMVDEADMYLLILAHRYGHVPTANNSNQISVTEWEYNHAVKRKIPCLVFVMHEDHSVKAADVEKGEGAGKLEKFKNRVLTKVANFFRSPADLRAHIINSLSQYRKPDFNALHYVSDIPQPPDAYIAHPYTLLQTHNLVGRRHELTVLTDWVAKRSSEVYKARLLNVVAIGGVGKSALTWKWFNDIAPQEMKPLAGRMWWSFYESDATFENFVTRALAYVSSTTLEEVQQISSRHREARLLAYLDRKPFLIVLDGLERLLIAYARMDAAHLSDDDAGDQYPLPLSGQRTGGEMAPPLIPTTDAGTFMGGANLERRSAGERTLRKTADPHAGIFLRNLSASRSARVLVSTRLYPADLQNKINNLPLRTCDTLVMPGLVDDDALELWRAFGVGGARDLLLPIFNLAVNHPLVIQTLAGEVGRYRRAPGDFDVWRRDHPDFDPFSLPLVQVKSHVLTFALRGLDEAARQTLEVISGFRMPAHYDAITALLIGRGKSCSDEDQFDQILTELEDRGLVGWDRRANRYDMHPVVRGVVWGELDKQKKRKIYRKLRTYFNSLGTINKATITSIADLTSEIELFNTLIGLERYKEAYEHWQDNIEVVSDRVLKASRQRLALLKEFFPPGIDQLPKLKDRMSKVITMHSLAISHLGIGDVKNAVTLLRAAIRICSENNMNYIAIDSYAELSNALRLCGKLWDAEYSGRMALLLLRQEEGEEDLLDEALQCLWLSTVIRGSPPGSTAFERVSLPMKSWNFACLAETALWQGRFREAKRWADIAWDLAQTGRHYERNLIRAARLQGRLALELDELESADERLHHALTRARAVNLVEEELLSLVALAKLSYRQRNLKVAREFLDDVWEAADRGPYHLIHTDACNLLAQIERTGRHKAAAGDAATKAYRLAWCDGPPFSYHWGLEAAKKHLTELGAPEPELPPFDESKFEPMPKVEIDPKDELDVEEDEFDVEGDTDD